MREKGSLINKIKVRFRILKEKRKKKKEEEKLKKIKKEIEILERKRKEIIYNRSKVTFMTLLGLFLGIFESKKKKTEYKKIEEELRNIEINIKDVKNEDYLKETVIKLEKVENIIKNITIPNFKKIEITKKTNDLRESIEIKKEELKEGKKINVKELNIIDENIEKQTQINLYKFKDSKKNEKIIISSFEDLFKQLNDLYDDINLENGNDIKKYQNKLDKINKEFKKYENEVDYKDYVLFRFKLDDTSKLINSKLKVENEEKLEKIIIDNNIEQDSKNQSIENNKIVSNTIVVGGLFANASYHLVKEIISSIPYNVETQEKELEEQDNDIKIEYKEELKNNITDQIKINNIEVLKEEVINKENKELQEKKQDDKKEKIKVKNKEILKDKNLIYSNDFKLSSDLIFNDLKEQEKELEEIDKKFNNLKISKINLFIKKALNIAVSFLPIKLFKNKLIGTLTSGLILNNRLKYIRKLTNSYDKEIILYNYKNILKEIKGNIDCLEKIKMISIDSLEQIEIIRNNILNDYQDSLEDEEVKNVLNHLKELELDITKKILKIEKEEEKLKKAEEKGKQKIKTIE